MKNAFATCHPLVNFLFFAFVLLYTMILIHPACLSISLICAFIYSIRLKGRRAARFNFLLLLPMMLATALINPAFNHAGVTILTYLPGGNPLTLESILYGAAAAVMLAAVICWFSCFHAIMTSDKFTYLFGRLLPALSLILSMVLRFVPRFREQIKAVSAAQKCIGRDVSDGSLLQRARQGITILSILVTWSLENAVETADSMRSRGYGLPGRSAFSIYRLDGRDKKALLAISAPGLYILIGCALGGLSWQYFPMVRGALSGAYTVSLLAACAALFLVPFVMDLWEENRWKASQSNI